MHELEAPIGEDAVVPTEILSPGESRYEAVSLRASLSDRPGFLAERLPPPIQSLFDAREAVENVQTTIRTNSERFNKRQAKYDSRLRLTLWATSSLLDVITIGAGVEGDYKTTLTSGFGAIVFTAMAALTKKRKIKN